MNKRILTTIAVILSINFTAKSQALEIIDAIAGTLLPTVVDGIKTIKESGNKSKIKVDREVFIDEMKDLNTYMNKITTALSNDAKSLKAIGDLSANGALLYDDLGAMDAMASEPIIEKIITCNVDDVQRAYAQGFYRDLQQLKKDITKMQTDIPSLSIDSGLKDDLTQKVNAISSDYTDLQSFLATSGIETPSSSSTPAQVVSYLEKVKDAGGNLSELKRSIQDMLGVLSSRLGTYSLNATSAKTEVDTKFKEIIEE